MRDLRVKVDDPERRYCACKEVQLCSCINHPPYHCGRCGRELTGEQLAEVRTKGWYRQSESAKTGN